MSDTENPRPLLTNSLYTLQLSSSSTSGMESQYDYQKDMQRMRWITTIFEVVQKLSRKSPPRTFSSLAWKKQLAQEFDKMGAEIRVPPGPEKKSLSFYTSLAILFVADNEVIATCPWPFKSLQHKENSEKARLDDRDTLRIALTYNPRFEKGLDQISRRSVSMTQDLLNRSDELSKHLRDYMAQLRPPYAQTRPSREHIYKATVAYCFPKLHRRCASGGIFLQRLLPQSSLAIESAEFPPIVSSVADEKDTNWLFDAVGTFEKSNFIDRDTLMDILVKISKSVYPPTSVHKDYKPLYTTSTRPLLYEYFQTLLSAYKSLLDSHPPKPIPNSTAEHLTTLGLQLQRFLKTSLFSKLLDDFNYALSARKKQKRDEKVEKKKKAKAEAKEARGKGKGKASTKGNREGPEQDIGHTPDNALDDDPFTALGDVFATFHDDDDDDDSFTALGDVFATFRDDDDNDDEDNDDDANDKSRFDNSGATPDELEAERQEIDVEAAEIEGTLGAFCKRLLGWLRVLVMHLNAVDVVLNFATLQQRSIEIEILDFEWNELTSEVTADSVLDEVAEGNHEAISKVRKADAVSNSLGVPFKGTVHCEAILMSYLVSELDELKQNQSHYEFHIGVSKLCCPVCLCFISHLARKKSLLVYIRGFHTQISAVSLPRATDQGVGKDTIDFFRWHLKAAMQALRPATGRSQSRHKTTGSGNSIMSLALSEASSEGSGMVEGEDSKDAKFASHLQSVLKYNRDRI